jgi:hypothetical protein
MRVIRGVGGVLLVLIGLLWIGQGLGMIGGSVMTGHPIYALLGIVVGLAGLWLVLLAARSPRGASGR